MRLSFEYWMLASKRRKGRRTGIIAGNSMFPNFISGDKYRVVPIESKEMKRGRVYPDCSGIAVIITADFLDDPGIEYIIKRIYEVRVSYDCRLHEPNDNDFFSPTNNFLALPIYSNRRQMDLFLFLVTM